MFNKKLRRLIGLSLIVCLFMSSCAHVSQYQDQRDTLQKKAEAELKLIDEGCKKKNGINSDDIDQLNNPSKKLTLKQYKYTLCYHGAKYVAFENSFEEKAAWKTNLQRNTKVIRSLYNRQISKKQAEKLIAKNNAAFEKKERIAITKILNDLRAKDAKGRSAAVAGALLAAIVVVAVIAANSGGGGGGNSYSGYSSSYAGNCACPYHLDAAGRRCGARSAWSRSGGASPQCY